MMTLAEVAVRIDIECADIVQARSVMVAQDTHQGLNRLQYRLLGLRLDSLRQRRLELSDALVSQHGIRGAAAQVEAWRRELQPPPFPDPRFAATAAQEV